MNDYRLCSISLKIDGDISLMISLHADGTINRKGTGTYEIDNDVYMGTTHEHSFQTLIKTITPGFEQYLGKAYDLPDKLGDTCTLEITLGDGKESTAMEFRYGTNSMGPPQEVADFVSHAVELTDGWYHLQQQVMAKRELLNAPPPVKTVKPPVIEPERVEVKPAPAPEKPVLEPEPPVVVAPPVQKKWYEFWK